MRYGLASQSGEYRAEDVILHAGETRFVFKTPSGDVAIRSQLTGRVNVYNMLAASCAGLARGMTLEQIAAALGVAPRTVKRDWAMARIWLFKELRKTPE